MKKVLVRASARVTLDIDLGTKQSDAYVDEMVEQFYVQLNSGLSELKARLGCAVIGRPVPKIEIVLFETIGDLSKETKLT